MKFVGKGFKWDPEPNILSSYAPYADVQAQFEGGHLWSFPSSTLTSCDAAQLNNQTTKSTIKKLAMHAREKQYAIHGINLKL